MIILPSIIWYSCFKRVLLQLIEGTYQQSENNHLESLHIMNKKRTALKSSVIEQKRAKSQNRCFKKTKHTQLSKKTEHFLPLIRTRTCPYQGLRNVHFFGNLACFDFLEHPFWDSHFCLINDDMTACSDFENSLTRKFVTNYYFFNYWVINSIASSTIKIEYKILGDQYIEHDTDSGVTVN